MSEIEELLEKIIAYADTSWYRGSPPKSDTATFYYRMKALEGNAIKALALVRETKPSQQAEGELMHEWLKKDAVNYDLPTEEIIQALAEDNERLCKRIAELEGEIDEAKKGCFGFMIRKDETLTAGINRNYAEFDDCHCQLEAEKKKLKKQLKNCICPHCGYGFDQAKESETRSEAATDSH